MSKPERELFKRFKVSKFLGKGSYGSVYRVIRFDDNQFYAVKETDVTKMSQTERQDAVNEIRLLASIRHENVVRYYEAFLDANWLCIVMEFASKGDLAGYIAKGKESRRPFPEEIIWNYFIQILRGVEALHQKRIIHRDLKPMNVFIGDGDVVKLGDLGIARILKQNVQAQTQIGTPYFMAPEIWQKQPYTFGADVWSVGCLLYEMMTYKLPFSADTMDGIKDAVIRGRVSEIRANYSPELKELCLRMLEKDPRRRPSISDILKMPAVAARARALPSADQQRQRVLDTIKVGGNIREISDKLPDACYDDDASIPAAR